MLQVMQLMQTLQLLLAKGMCLPEIFQFHAQNVNTSGICQYYLIHRLQLMQMLQYKHHQILTHHNSALVPGFNFHNRRYVR